MLTAHFFNVFKPQKTTTTTTTIKQKKKPLFHGLTDLPSRVCWDLFFSGDKNYPKNTQISKTN